MTDPEIVRKAVQAAIREANRPDGRRIPWLDERALEAVAIERYLADTDRPAPE